jgi:2-amino-4-hydroxy-6-hydroxymethyldihydropteridine diphosphokinase
MEAGMTEAILALGSNLGDRAGNLRAAIDLLGERGVRVMRASSVWETAPVPADQPTFLNAVIAAETALAPRELLTTVKDVEHVLGRRPGRRWGPRPIDIDILFYGEERVDDPNLVIPHPEISRRVFVLAPLAEVTSGPLPGLSATATELLAAAHQAGATRTGIQLIR